ncbi:hypothetical protein IJH27_01620 [Candidatus Saccharibacteria bacterium]|nr:hypothetical protein [Candidatus Saccharibacteria bacterium]
MSADKTSETSPKNPAHSSLLTPVIDALNDDLNSPAAFAYLDSVLDSLTLDDFHALEDLFALDLIPKDKSLELAPLIERRNLARQKKILPPPTPSATTSLIRVSPSSTPTRALSGNSSHKYVADISTRLLPVLFAHSPCLC